MADSISSSRPVHWAILGTGNVARQFAEGLRYVSGSRLVAVGSRTEAKAEAMARDFGAPCGYGSYEQVVGDPDVDVVYIGTPNHRHKDDCLLAINAGKAVVCEKPFALNAAEAKEVIALARRNGVFCMEAMWTRFLPLMARLRTLLDERVIGDVRLVRADFGIPKSPEKDNRFFDREMGGGAMLNFGVYLASLTSFMLGTPSSIVAEATFSDTGVDERSVAVLRYQTEAMAVLTCSIRDYLPCEALLLGSRGEIRIHSPAYCPHRLTVVTSRQAAPPSPLRRSRFRSLRGAPLLREAWSAIDFTLRRIVGTGARRYVELFDGNGFNYEAADVSRRLRAGELESPTMPLDETATVMATLDAIRCRMECGAAETASAAATSWKVDS